MKEKNTPAGSEGKKEKQQKQSFQSDERFQGRVIELIGRTGARGEATQARVKVLTGFDKDKIIRRNIKGPVRVDDIIMMLETEMEAAPMHSGRNKKEREKVEK
ncbi:MAG: 30S ribosomal protein S28e [Candidatus Nanoarchaeia archaeon]|nr:30S ribosomal protein S28e [Candidatus Nanoarchaeia archaeon]MDD5054153.1 30S ribosomal protein S28e [Candidatus Nanoarchaeia archaeon]MDD5499536.1 30S ribosomal protein S28e [Candidatus Nanoarchaeia archaeon]